MKLDCRCSKWVKNIDMINDSIMDSARRYEHDGLEDSFSYCPWCGRELDDHREKDLI
jgi:hypothetical protein